MVNMGWLTSPADNHHSSPIRLKLETSHLVASPRITASLRHSDKMVEMEQLNKAQLEAQVVRLLEHYSYT